LTRKRKWDIPSSQTKRAKIMKAMRSTLTVPPRFYEYEKQEDDDDKGACEEFIILGGP